MLEKGQTVGGRYKILDQIGQGGMSTVYLAVNERANKRWVIKEIQKNIPGNGKAGQREAAEIELMKKLDHPDLPSIVDIIETEEASLIVMDYIEGQTLDCVLRKRGTLPQRTVEQWGRQLCDALCDLHSRNPPVIYRDMKPANIILRPDGTVALIDFGAAREFKENSRADTVCLGTRGYAAPEQYGGSGQTDVRTDIYGLGATLYHLLTGRDPGRPPYEIYPIRRWNPALSAEMEKIILKCTRQDPEKRYQSGRELMKDLERCAAAGAKERKAGQKKWRLFAAAAIAGAAAGLLAEGLRTAEKIITARTYDWYVREAEALSYIDPEKCVQYFKDAVELDPSRGDAYEGLLNFYLWKHNADIGGDGSQICVFSDKEEQEMRKLLGLSENRSRRNEDRLAENKGDYERFAYELGIAYFYSYQGKGSKTAARKWLGIAARAKPTEKLGAEKIQRAASLYKISGYYDNLDIRSRSEGAAVSYRDYWEDLVVMAEQEREQPRNQMNQLLIYQELTAQIFSSAAEFRDAGVTEKQMDEELDRIEESFSRIKPENKNEEYEIELKRKVRENLDLARDNLEAVFNTENIEGDERDGTGNSDDS